jgi:hypothetical protein
LKKRKPERLREWERIKTFQNELIPLFEKDVKNDSKDTIHKIEWRLKEFGEYHSTTKTIRLPFTFSKERLDHLQLECGRRYETIRDSNFI